MGDAELEAMSTVVTALADLEENAQGRVLRWAAERYGVTMPMGGRRNEGTAGGGTGSNGDVRGSDVPEQEIADDAPSYEHFAELFAAASPKTNEDKALVTAYWVQVHEGQDEWQSRRLNTELKHVGQAIPNVTDALTSNMRKKPQRVIQLKKSGSTKQANKTCKVTNEGIVYVQGMLSGRTA